MHGKASAGPHELLIPGYLTAALDACAAAVTALRPCFAGSVAAALGACAVVAALHSRLAVFAAVVALLSSLADDSEVAAAVALHLRFAAAAAALRPEHADPVSLCSRLAAPHAHVTAPDTDAHAVALRSSFAAVVAAALDACALVAVVSALHLGLAAVVAAALAFARVAAVALRLGLAADPAALCPGLVVFAAPVEVTAKVSFVSRGSVPHDLSA